MHAESLTARSSFRAGVGLLAILLVLSLVYSVVVTQTILAWVSVWMSVVGIGLSILVVYLFYRLVLAVETIANKL